MFWEDLSNGCLIASFVCPLPYLASQVGHIGESIANEAFGWSMPARRSAAIGLRIKTVSSFPAASYTCSPDTTLFNQREPARAWRIGNKH